MTSVLWGESSKARIVSLRSDIEEFFKGLEPV